MDKIIPFKKESIFSNKTLSLRLFKTDQEKLDIDYLKEVEKSPKLKYSDYIRQKYFAPILETL